MQELQVTLVPHPNPDRTMLVQTVRCPWTHSPHTGRRCWRCREYLGYLKDPKRGEFVRCNRAEDRAQ